MLHRSLALSLALSAFAQQPPPFTPTAEIGKPHILGTDPEKFDSLTVDRGTKLELTLESVELVLAFPNRVEIVIANANSKILVLRGSARNVSTETVSYLTAGTNFALRLPNGTERPKEFRKLGAYDPQTLKGLDAKIPPGGTAKFIQLLQIPADHTAMRLGMYYYRPVRIAWYDLRPHVKFSSAFAAPDHLTSLPTAQIPAGSAFDFDGLELRVSNLRRKGREGFTVDIAATNKMLLPSRWGWQYFTAELLGASGEAIRFYPEVIDTATGKLWIGDLPEGASTTGQYTFNTPAGFSPRALRLTSSASNRIAEVQLPR